MADKLIAVLSCLPNTTNAGKSYVIFGKTDTDAVDLSKLGDESKYTIDYLGNKDDNTLTSTVTNKDEIFRLVCQRPHTLCLPYLNHH
jgi:hypothetical protein